ncbi:MAG: VOC family protein [Chloroflexota bacterium]|nr:VOC family protein [Chloroflexota bacterium]
MKKLTTCLWFDGQAEEAMNFYTSVFKNAKKGEITRWGDTGPGEPGSVLTATFEILGQEFMALNGGPEFKFNEAVSFVVDCETQEEIDRMWDTLIAGGGEPSQCGWLKDKFGLSWQITPPILGEMLGDKNRKRADRVMQAMMLMTKIDIATLKRAYEEPVAAR